MKQFKNLDEAFHYQASCPICSEPIEPDYKEKIANSSWDKPKIATVFTLTGGDEISIDYYNNEVLTYTEANKYNYTYGAGNSYVTSHSGNYNIYKNGTLMFAIHATCYKCGLYGYNIQAVVDWKERAIVGLFLNSESISIEEPDGTLHEIKNFYSSEKTTYDKFTKVDIDDGTVKMSGYSGRRNSTITFPLMPLDVKSPSTLLNRIKKLIIFS